MGEVYRATDTVLKRQVALKVLPADVVNNPERVARFQREAEVLAALNHPNVAHLYGVETSDGRLALVMELVEGVTLADRIVIGPVPLDDALPIATQIADALEAAHARGIIHRDLKPANIKLRDDGTVKVLDFGLAKAMEPPVGGVSAVAITSSPTITSPPLMTGVGVLIGTAAYMSPEQARGSAADKRSDLWSFGCILFEMLAGVRPFDGDGVADVLAAVLRLEPDWTKLPPETPSSVRVLVQNCLAKDARKRIGDISVARFVLSAPGGLLSSPITASNVDAAGSSARVERADRVRRRNIFIGIGVVAGLLLLASAFIDRPLPLRALLLKGLGVANQESFSGAYSGVVSVTQDNQSFRMNATMNLSVSGHVAAGSYTNDTGDSGTLSGTLDGNSLVMQFNSSTGGLDCMLSARVSEDRNTIDAIYKCDSADPARVMHANAVLKR